MRDALDLKPGDKVRYFICDGEVRIRPLVPIERLFGILKHDGPPVSLEDIRRGIIEGACRSALGGRLVAGNGRGGGADFADRMIAAAARRAGALPLYTFDRKAARLPGVTLLEAR